MTFFSGSAHDVGNNLALKLKKLSHDATKVGDLNRGVG
jgi:hypothetical protein